jgi:putative ABC transport system substrate-binding protein
MSRRQFIALLSGAAVSNLFPLIASAQRGPARLEFIASGSEKSTRVFVDAFRAGMSDQGLVEGPDYVLDGLWAEGDYASFPAFARAVVDRNPRVIMVNTIASAKAVQAATTTIPIVMVSLNDPVGYGLIANLARPGGNITGTATLNEDLTLKLMELLHEVVPQASTVAALFNPGNPSHFIIVDKIAKHAAGMGVGVVPSEVKFPAVLRTTFAGFADGHMGAVLVLPDAALLDLREDIAALALQHRLPLLSTWPEMTIAGGLIGYGASRIEMYQRSAYYVRKILDGAKPADLPVEQPSRIELSVNLRTAQTLGISLPAAILARAHRIIE